MALLRVMSAVVLTLLFSRAAMAIPTEIVIRVIAKDGKFIGHPGTGGVAIVLRDAETGEVLAQGVTSGGNGVTEKIMTTGHARRDVLSKNSAQFSASLDLQRPRLIAVTATGPLIPKGAAMTVTSTQWVLPGKPVNGGDGWVLEMPGFAITVLGTPPSSVRLDGRPAEIPFRAKITMQCDCEIEPGSLWDPNKFEIAAMLEKDGKTFPPSRLVYDGRPSFFHGAVAVAEPGDYTIDIYAYDPATGNTGLIKLPLTAR
jgi:hypothetical protein